MMHAYRQLAWIGLMLLHLGCGASMSNPASSAFTQSKVRVTTAVLDTYVGTYRLASGAQFPVVRDGDRLLAGTPPRELHAQTTREFRSNHLPGEFHFERAGTASTVTLCWRLAQRDHVCQPVNTATSTDPTQQVDAGGHRLRMLVSGTGSPTIVLEDGIGNGIDLQADLQAELMKRSTVVTYDHAGTGGSESGPLPRDATQIARELRLALQDAGQKPPFLLMGSSIGADYIRVFAHQFPTDTAGLILLDPTPEWERMFAWAELHAPARIETYRQLVEETGAMMEVLMSVQEPGREAEWAAMDMTRAAARRALPLSGIPIVQITGAAGRQTSAISADKIRFFDEWLRQCLPQAKHVLALHSGHAVAITDRSLVLEEVSRMLTEVRQKQVD